MVLEKLELPKSTFYYHSGKESIDKWKDVRPLIKEIYSRTPNGMGYRQVAMALRQEQGLAISGKTVLKLMQQEGLRCKIRSKKYNSHKGEVGRVAKNILNREFKADEPMKKLATDITEFKVAGQKAYLSPILDMYNNEVIAWDVSQHPNMAQIERMLNQISEKSIAKNSLLHSDQGWQYQQRKYQIRLEELGITQSMSRKATCLDNACMEGFFGHLKDEFYRGRKFESFKQFKEELDEYINYWNNQRYQVGLQGMTPVQYRGHSIRAA